MKYLFALLIALAFALVQPSSLHAEPRTYRLYQGVTFYVHNPEGKAFDIKLDVRDLNLFAPSAREVLWKVYSPDGEPVVREIIPDDGVASPNFPGAMGGWDHELQYYANLRIRGAQPSIGFSAWSDPARLNTIKARTFNAHVEGGQKGVYRIVIAGQRDHYVTLDISPDLEVGTVGHPNYHYVIGNAKPKSYIYVPKNTTGVFFSAADPDPPFDRHFTLKAPDGTVLFDGVADGGYVAQNIPFKPAGKYDDQLLTLEISDASEDAMVKVSLLQPREDPFKDYTGMCSRAILCDTPELANALQGGTTVHDGLVFWHPFQIRLHDWVKANLDQVPEDLRDEVTHLRDRFRILETSDGRGSGSWANFAYGMGYYGFKIWHQAYVVMNHPDVPAELKDILREGLVMAADRLSFATAVERVNGNAFSQIPVHLWYAWHATKDPLIKQRLETFWSRWKNGTWAPGAGLSPSGDSQEHFAHDNHYGSYLLDNWVGDQWVDYAVLDDAKTEGDDRFQKVIDRYRELYTYLYCEDENGRPVAANPWSSRTASSAHKGKTHILTGGHELKAKPGEDFTVSVNDGDEWFAARREHYYMLTFHGRLAPDWMSNAFAGQLGYGGGTICQFTVPGHGPVLTSTLHDAYGKGQHISEWRNYHIHSLVGVMRYEEPLIAGISEHFNARLTGDTVASSGHVRGTRVDVQRSYTYEPDHVAAHVSLSPAAYNKIMAVWSNRHDLSQVAEAYEMFPVIADRAGKMRATVTLFDEADKPLGPASAELASAKRIRIDRGGFGVDIVLDQPRPVKLGEYATVLVQLVSPDTPPVSPDKVVLDYQLKPFVH